ncbi:MAG: C39 family peptidase [Oscillospiraceae bacterium]
MVKKKILNFMSVILAVLVFPIVDASAQTVGSDKQPMELLFNVTDCTDGKRNGKINVKLKNYDESGSYSISFDSGKKYYPMENAEKNLVHAKNGFYNICVIKKGDEAVRPDIYTVYVGSDKEKFSVKAHFISSGESIYKDGKIQAVIDNYDEEKDYELVLNDGEKIIPFKKSKMDMPSLTAGKYKMSVRESSSDKLRHSPIFTVKVKEAVCPRKMNLSVKMILQNPELPTGCEITSLAMLLDYIGFKADKLLLADKYLEKGKYRAADPNKVFVGDPKSTFAYGCYSDVIVNAAEKFLKEKDSKNIWKVRNITGCNANSLYSAVGSGNPVVVWATMNMKAPRKGAEWTIAETNEKYVWTAGEHCLLLTGYDSKAKLVYVNDPLKGEVTYDQSDFEKRFVQMGRNAVIITKTDSHD